MLMRMQIAQSYRSWIAAFILFCGSGFLSRATVSAQDAEIDQDRLMEVVLPVLADAAKVAGQSEDDDKKKEDLIGWERVTDGWRDLGRWDMLLDIALVLLVAMALGAVIAYHPLTRSKVSSIEEFEQPKTFIMYAMVGAVIAQIVQVKPEMALVVFGIGGLLRFRTDVGQAKDTGRVILVTVVGLCCGLKIFVVGFLATIFGWLLIYYLESQQAERVQIKGIETGNIPEAANLYRQILIDAGCKIIRERKNFTKSQVNFVFSFPSGADRESLQQRFEEVPTEHRGTVDWETT